MRLSVASSRLGTVLSALILASCSGGGGSPGNAGGGSGIQTAPDVVYTIPGPYSQTYTPAGGTAFTATQVKLTYLGFPGMPGGQPYESLRIDTTFSQDITNALPPAGTMLNSGTQLGVYVGLDVDDNPTTGTSGIGCQGFPGETGQGDEFFIDSGSYYGRLADGNYALVKTTQSMGDGGDGEVVTSVAGNTLTQIVMLSSLANYSAVPKIGVYASVSNGDAPGYSGAQAIGQCAPSSGEYVTGA